MFFFYDGQPSSSIVPDLCTICSGKNFYPIKDLFLTDQFNLSLKKVQIVWLNLRFLIAIHYYSVDCLYFCGRFYRLFQFNFDFLMSLLSHNYNAQYFFPTTREEFYLCPFTCVMLDFRQLTVELV